MARLPSKNISAAKTLAPPKARTKTETETDEHNPQDFGPVAVLSADPPIFLTGMAFQSMIGIAPAFAGSYGSRPAAFLIYPCWTIEDRYRSAEVIAAARAHRDEHPEHELVFLCNSAAETEALASGGLNAQLLNKNFTVSDTVFRRLRMPRWNSMRSTMRASIRGSATISLPPSSALPISAIPAFRPDPMKSKVSLPPDCSDGIPAMLCSTRSSMDFPSGFRRRA
jgi:hypothetical protein